MGHGEKVNLGLECLVTKDLPGSMKRLSVLRKGKVEDVTIGFVPLVHLAKRFDRVDCQPTYFMIGGYVFAPLSMPLIMHNHQDIPAHLVQQAFRSWKKDDEEIVLLQKCLNHEINEGYYLDEFRILLTVQGQKIKNMDGLVRAVAAVMLAKSDYLIFGFET